MPGLPELRPGTVNNTALPDTVIANPGGATALSDDSDATFDAQSDNATGTYGYGRNITDPPVDFGTMTGLNVLLRYGWQSAPTNTTWNLLAARVMGPAGTTVLAAANSGGAFKTVASNITATTPTNSATITFDYVNPTTDRALWDGAVLQVQWTRTRAKGGDNLGMRVYEAKINGTYDLAPPAITSVGTPFRDGQTAVAIAGSGFEATQGTGKVELSDNATYATGTKVTQTVTSWNTSAIQFTGVLGALAPGPLWVWVTTNGALRNTVGFPVTVHRKVAFTIYDSPHFTGVPASTAQLTPPSGKTTSNFTPGWLTESVIVTNIDIADNGYTELEWSLTPTGDAPTTQQYEFRVIAAGAPLDTYTVGTPKWTIGTPPAAVSPPPITRKRYPTHLIGR